MPLSPEDQERYSTALHAAGERVAAVLPHVYFKSNGWDVSHGESQLVFEFTNGPRAGSCQTVELLVCFYQREGRELYDEEWSEELADGRDLWAGGSIAFIDMFPAFYGSPVWRSCVLEELAAAVRDVFPLGAAELRVMAAAPSTRRAS